MNNAPNMAVVVNALLKGSRWMEPLSGLNPVEELRKKLLGIGKADDLYAVVLEGDRASARDSGGRVLGGFRPVTVRDLKAREVFREIGSVLKGYDDVLYHYADAPLLDMEIARKMAGLHREELAEYTYGEGFPIGVSPEILKTSLFTRCAALMEKDEREIDRESIFTALSKEINSFDIETLFAPENLKLRRIELSDSLERNRLAVERVVSEKGFSCSYGEFCTLIREKPGILRTLPSFVEVEITNRTNSTCIYSPLPFLKRETGDMTLEHYRFITGMLGEFSGDIALSLSYLGEPLLHPDIREIVEHTLADEKARLILETDGRLFSPSFSDYIAGLNAENLFVIFDIDAVQDETYGVARGTPVTQGTPARRAGTLRNVERNLRYLLSKGVKNVYAQLVRMDANEGEMLKFFDLWENEGAKVIIQKYNSFLGLLPDRAKYDLRPLDRMPCWHLLRDLVVFRDGRAPRCKQDINAHFNLGNLLLEGPEEVWERGLPHYLQHCRGLYDAECSVCDEFFTFNL